VQPPSEMRGTAVELAAPEVDLPAVQSYTCEAVKDTVRLQSSAHQQQLLHIRRKLPRYSCASASCSYGVLAGLPACTTAARQHAGMCANLQNYEGHHFLGAGITHVTHHIK
jgi:hypothetical protein